MMSAGTKCIVIGGTGAIGKALVNELCANDAFKEITLIGRRKLEEPIDCDRIKQFVVDMDSMSSIKSELGDQDVAFCCLGTTRKAAGSAEAFRRVDYEYALNFANLSKDLGVRSMNLVTSGKANSKSWLLYLKTKGEIEDAVKGIDFKWLNIYRPGLLDRGSEIRFHEKIAGIFFSKISVQTVAKAMVKVTCEQLSGQGEYSQLNVLENDKIKELAEKA